MIEFYIKTVKDERLQKIDSFREGCWINVESPEKEEIDKLSKDFEIDITWINDSLDIDSKSRIEQDNGNVLIITRIPYKDEDDEITTMPFGIIISKNFLMTISLTQNQIIEDIKNEKFKVNTTQRIRFVLRIFERINRNFDKYLDYLRKKSEMIENQVSISLSNSEIYQLLQIQKTLIYFSSAIVANEIVFEKINSGKIFKMYEEDKDIIEDIVLSNREIYEGIKIMRDVLSNTLDAYASIVSNNLNIVMKFLTSVSIILSFSVLIASFYGMNVELPFQNDPNAFWYILITSLASFWFLYMFFKRKNWL
ncbi:MAG: magnesium transporter CorA family protein [Candidatus Aenigmarchaeota archaeon]|nr:magnesium transporter CorA family protein [Candidatus Aenigmarchaeota archaeon]